MKVASHHWPTVLLIHQQLSEPLEEEEVHYFYGEQAELILSNPIYCINCLASITVIDPTQFPKHVCEKWSHGIKLYV
jgi:hypothetical protein